MQCATLVLCLAIVCLGATTKFSNENPTSGYPSFLLANARSLNGKMGDLEERIKSTYGIIFEVAVVTETWGKDEDITEYKRYSEPRDNGQLGGGLALYVRETIESHEARYEVPPEVEVLWCRVNPWGPNGGYVLVGAVYFTSNTHDRQVLDAHLRHVLTEEPNYDVENYHGVAIMGDFNDFKEADILVDFNLKQVVDRPTHEDGGILDRIMTNMDLYYSVPGVEEPLHNDESTSVSDHNVVTWIHTQYVR